MMAAPAAGSMLPPDDQKGIRNPLEFRPNRLERLTFVNQDRALDPTVPQAFARRLDRRASLLRQTSINVLEVLLPALGVDLVRELLQVRVLNVQNSDAEVEGSSEARRLGDG